MFCKEFICSNLTRSGHTRKCKEKGVTCLAHKMKECTYAHDCKNCNNINCDTAYEMRKPKEKSAHPACPETVCEGVSEKVVAMPQVNKVKQENKQVPYAYVDGSYNPYTKKYGYGGFVDDGERHVLQGSGDEPDMVSMRNVAGEIMGAMAAIEYAINNNFKELIIYYDYTGIEMWATGKWRANKEGTQRYKEFCEKSPVKLIFKKVPAHKGITGNETADHLAKKAVGL